MFKVTFTNGEEDLSLYFKLRDTVIAKKWYDELSKNYELWETDRLENWFRNKEDVINLLNEKIDIINDYQYLIDRKVTEKTNQDDLNYLHKFFEDLRGDCLQGTIWYHQAPNVVQNALSDFNILIHQLESMSRKKNKKHPTATITFKNRPILELSEEDMQHFTYKWQKGTVYINYCQIGKTVLDVFNDKDNITDAVRPQIFYSADLMIKFGPSTKNYIYLIRSFLLNRWLKKKNFSHKNLNLGMIPVADLVSPIENSILFKFNKVKEVKCIK